MATFFNGKTIAQPVYNSNNISSIFYNGNCVFSGDKPSYLQWFTFDNNYSATAINVFLGNSLTDGKLISYDGANTYRNGCEIYSKAKKLNQIYLNNCDNLCRNLRNVKDFSNIMGMNWSKITNLHNMFQYCWLLNQNILIPEGPTNAFSMFECCFNLNQNILIPNSVKTTDRMFLGCSNLNQNILIPNSVNSTSRMFSSCSNLNQNIWIPNSVNSTSSMFANCYNLNQKIIIRSYKFANFMFENCFNLNQDINLVSMFNTSNMFANCYNIRYINAAFKGVTYNANYMFANCYRLDFNNSSVAGNLYLREFDTYAIGNKNGIFSNCIKLMSKVNNIIFWTSSRGVNYIKLFGVTNNVWVNTSNFNLIIKALTTYMNINLYDNANICGGGKVWYNKKVIIYNKGSNIGCLSWIYMN